MRSEAQVRAEKKYNAKMVGVSLKMNPEKDADIIQFLERVENKQETIKKAIREMMAHNGTL